MLTNDDAASARQLGQSLERWRPLLPVPSYEFLTRVFADGLGKYQRRLRQYGFTGRGRVLDAGCGFGQWALALASLNRRVDAVDCASDRLFVLEELCQSLGVDNLTPTYGTLTDLPYPDGQFDAAFCYGALFLTEWRQSLQELRRVLAPSGRLYLNANGLGWYLHLWKNRPNAAPGYDPRAAAAAALQNTVAYDAGRPLPDGRGVVIDPDELLTHLDRLGFRRCRIGGEGSLCEDTPLEPPFFKATYEGQPGVWEIIADL